MNTEAYVDDMTQFFKNIQRKIRLMIRELHHLQDVERIPVPNPNHKF